MVIVFLWWFLCSFDYILSIYRGFKVYLSRKSNEVLVDIFWSLRIYHIGVHTVHYDTHALFSSTKLWIYYKKKNEQVRIIISYKSAMDSNTFLFYPTDPKIGHSQVGQTQVTSTYIRKSSSPVSMARKYQKQCIK